MVSTRPLISKSSSPFINPLRIVPSSKDCSIGVTVTFLFYSFLVLMQGLNTYLSCFIFTLSSTGTTKSTIRQVLFFSCWLSFGLVVYPRLDHLFVPHNPRLLLFLLKSLIDWSANDTHTWAHTHARTNAHTHAHKHSHTHKCMNFITHTRVLAHARTNPSTNAGCVMAKVPVCDLDVSISNSSRAITFTLGQIP